MSPQREACVRALAQLRAGVTYQGVRLTLHEAGCSTLLTELRVGYHADIGVDGVLHSDMGDSRTGALYAVLSAIVEDIQ